MPRPCQRLYTYQQSSDGTETIFDIRSPRGEILAVIPYWDDEETAEMKAELIVSALNAFRAGEAGR